MNFLDLKVILIKPKLVFGSKGKFEYFAVSYEERLLGSQVHLHVREVGQTERALNERPYHTYLKCDAPDFALRAIEENT